jgi:sulfocyanin
MRWLMAMLVVGAAGCRERTSSADAARADSSAAGYAVGVRRASTVAAGVATPGTTEHTDLQPSTATRVATTAPAVPAAPRGNPTTTSRAVPPRDTARSGAGTTTVPNVATRQPRDDSAATPQPVAEGPVHVNEFLTYDQRSRTVSLQLIAGYNGLNGSLNYNGATHGSHGLYVPTGWRIHVAVTNRDSDLQHSAIVLQKVLPPPIEPTEPAFTAAALPQLDEGLQEDETGTIDFVADRAGQYMIACGVPGHAQAGMWLQLAVSNGLKVPAYR